MAQKANAKDPNAVRKPTTSFGRITKPKPSLKIKLRAGPRPTDTPPRLTTPYPPSPAQLNGTFEPPMTPIKQIMPPPQTPMAPKRFPPKRPLSEANAEEQITLDTPPSRLLEILTATEAFHQPSSSSSLPSSTPSTPTQRPHSTLSKQGLAVFAFGPPRKTKINKHTTSTITSTTSQALIQQTEGDPSVLSRLLSLVDRGRRAGGSPSYTFKKRGRSRIRYEYMSTQDEEYQAAVDDDDESPRKRRREGSPLSLDDRKSLKEMYFRPCHIPESIDFEV